MSNGKLRDFRIAVVSLSLVVVLFAFTISGFFFIRGASHDQACELIRNNNIITVEYLREFEDHPPRIIHLIHKLKEGIC